MIVTGQNQSTWIKTCHSDRAKPKYLDKNLSQCRFLDSVTKMSKRLRISNIMYTCVDDVKNFKEEIQHMPIVQNGSFEGQSTLLFLVNLL
jgi:hypothetical protein